MKPTITKLAVTAATVLTPMLAMAQWKIGVESGVVRNTLLVSKCYDYDRHYTGSTNSYLNIPIYARFSFGGSKVPFDSRRDNRFDAGVSGAIGVEYQFAI